MIALPCSRASFILLGREKQFKLEPTTRVSWHHLHFAQFQVLQINYQIEVWILSLFLLLIWCLINPDTVIHRYLTISPMPDQVVMLDVVTIIWTITWWLIFTSASMFYSLLLVLCYKCYEHVLCQTREIVAEIPHILPEHE